MPHRCRATGHSHTVSGLLDKRAELFNRASQLEAETAAARNGIAAIDDVLALFGHDTHGLDAQMPKAKQNVIFGRGQLTRAIQDVLRGAGEPKGTRAIATAVAAQTGLSMDDRAFAADMVRRTGKALRTLERDGRVAKSITPEGQTVWCAKPF